MQEQGCRRLRQEWGDAVSPGLGGGFVLAVGSKGGTAESPLRHTVVLGRKLQAV